MSASNYVYEKFSVESEKIFNLNTIAHPHGGLITSFCRVKEPSTQKESSAQEICISYYNRKKSTWTEPKCVYSIQTADYLSFVMYLDLKADLILLINAKKEILHLQSSNYGKMWSKARIVFSEPNNYMFKNQPIFVEMGKTLVPIYESKVGRSLALISEDNGKNWYLSTYIEPDLENLQEEITEDDKEASTNRVQTIYPVFIHQGENDISAFMQGVKLPNIWSANSEDLGETWFEALPTKLESTEGPIDAIHLIDENGIFTPVILLVKLDYISTNIRLKMEHSNDNGEKWKSITSLFDPIPNDSFKNISDCAISQSPQEKLIDILYISNKNQINHVSFLNTNLI
jgi:hypothetical protein